MQSIDSIASILPFYTATQYSPPRAAPNVLKSYGLGMVFRRVLEGLIFWKIKPESHLPAGAEMECCGVRAGLKQTTNVTEPS